MKLYEIYLQEAGFEKLPKGWTKASVKKTGKTIAKDVGEKSPKEVGFFDKCVKKMTGKVDSPEGYCASLKDVSYGSTYWRGKGKTKKKAMAMSRRYRNVGEQLDNLAILYILLEYEENAFIDYCLQYDCPKKRLVCLRMARALCGSNKVCQQRIDRQRDELIGSYDGSGDDPDQDLKHAGPSLQPFRVGAVVVKKEDITANLPLGQLLRVHRAKADRIKTQNCLIARRNILKIKKIVKEVNKIIDDCEKKKKDCSNSYRSLQKIKEIRTFWREKRDKDCY